MLIFLPGLTTFDLADLILTLCYLSTLIAAGGFTGAAVKIPRSLLPASIANRLGEIDQDFNIHVPGRLRRWIPGLGIDNNNTFSSDRRGFQL